MSAFLGREKARQIRLKETSALFSIEAKADGVYRRRPRPFCLPVHHAEENLYSEIRRQALAYFARHRISWHDGQNGKPSSHLCSSQVCCVNFLFPFVNKPDALAVLLRQVFPDLRRVLPIEDDQYLAFEWIGARNYLNERTGTRGERTRGANTTSADAAVLWETLNGKRRLALIEWKYTESYGGQPIRFSPSGTDRLLTYRPFLECADGPIDTAMLPSLDALFYSPFDQLMRQQLLAAEMEKARELGAEVVSLLHVAPAANRALREVTSPPLLSIADTAIGVWQRLLRGPGRFVGVSTERLFAASQFATPLELGAWREFLAARYTWLDCDEGLQASEGIV